MKIKFTLKNEQYCNNYISHVSSKQNVANCTISYEVQVNVTDHRQRTSYSPSCTSVNLLNICNGLQSNKNIAIYNQRASKIYLHL